MSPATKKTSRKASTKKTTRKSATRKAAPRKSTKKKAAKKARVKKPSRAVQTAKRAYDRVSGAIRSIKREDVVRIASEAAAATLRAAEKTGQVAAAAGHSAARSRVTAHPIQRARSILATTLRKLEPRAKSLKLLLLDVDGVLTDGGIVYMEGGGEVKRFDIQDGMGVDLLMRAGIDVGILTGRRSEMVERRARELGISIIKQGFYDKNEALDEIVSETGLSPNQVGYVGDDVQDLSVMRRVGFRAAPGNAVPEVQAEVDYVCSCVGGHGAVREVAEVILYAIGKMQKVIAEASTPGVKPPPGRETA